MIKHIGNSASFQTLAILCGVTSLAYFLVNKFVLSKYDEKSPDVEKQSQEKEANVNEVSNNEVPKTNEEAAL